MAKTTQAALIWLQERQGYLWQDGEDVEASVWLAEPEEWLQRLSEHTSFSFRGREGQVAMLKETRPRGGDGYWYAYRRRGKRTVKKYAGRTGDLTFARLEHMARALTPLPERTENAQDNIAVSETLEDSGKVDWQVTRLPQQQLQALAPSTQDSLLISKFHLPRLHSSLVRRERLMSLLDHALEPRVTLVSAPAGFGKTTLVRQWVAERDKQPPFPPVAWVSLEVGDNDPVRFWRYLITACQAFHDAKAYAVVPLLNTFPQPPFDSSFIEAALTAFLNALARYEQRGLLVLDDYHVITSPPVQETMTFFLDHLPANMHVIIIARSDPPFPLARLRARNELYEVRTPELRFSLEETATFLQQMVAFPLTPKVIELINVHLEGWAAGLRLLLVALREHTRPVEIEDLLRTFASGQRVLQEYFLGEVFNTQPEPIQSFLLQTSMLGRLTASLCDVITGRGESERVLEKLEHANLFLEPLDSSGQWYRYHGLFAEAMQQEARRRLGENALRGISSQASHWYETHGLYTEAVETALHAHEYIRAAVLIERILDVPHYYHQANEYHTLYNWLEQIPEVVLKQYPALCFGYAVAHLSVIASWRLTQATLTSLEKLLCLAEQGFRAEQKLPKLGEVFAFRSLIAWRQEEAVQAAQYARQALAWLVEEQLMWRGLSLSIVGKAELLQLGRVDVAQSMLEEAYVLCDAVDNRYFKRATANMLATVFYEQGALHRAAEYYQRALNEARERADSDDIGHALLGLARISYEWNELETAQRQAQEVLAIGKSLEHGRYEAQATLLLARVQHARGERAAAYQRMTALLARMPAILAGHTSSLALEARTLQARFALASGDHATVQRWVAASNRSTKNLSPFISEQKSLVLARWYLAQGREVEAQEILQHLLDEARQAGRKRSALEAQALLIQVYVAREKDVEAQHMLHELLAQTYIEGYQRLFLDEGDAMMTLLRTLAPHVREKPLYPYLQSLLPVFSGEQKMTRAISFPLPLLEPLSAQEQRVLRQLVLGRSNAEIARELVVSVNTIRTQVQSIYRKLDVHNRVAAGEVARRYHLV